MLFRVWLVRLLSIALILTGLEFIPAPAQAAPNKDTAPLVAERPDGRSAMLTARSQGQQVEDLSQRTETAQTWAQPDGTWKTSIHTGQQRFRDVHGNWVNVNLALAPTADGGVAPGATQDSLKLPGAGSGGAISVDHGAGRSISIGSPGQLPKPTLTDTTATYPGIAPGVDMVVQALRSGFEQTFVIQDRSAVTSTGLSWSLPLKTKGLDVRQESDGSVSFVDNKGAVHSRIPAAYAWDSRVGTSQETSTSYGKVTLKVVVKNPGQATLVVTPDASWLNDAATVYPVTVDPTYLMSSPNPVWDTYIQQGSTTSFYTSTVLKIGSAATGQNTRSYLNFDLSSLKGKVVIGSNLKMVDRSAGTCSARGWDAYYMTGTAGPSWNWGNQSYWGAKQASSTQTAGASGSCPAAWVAMDTTALVQTMLNDSQSVNTIGLRAGNESDASYVKQFDSMETTNDPVLNIQYDRYPNGPSVASLSSPSVSFNNASYVGRSTPIIKTTATDPDGNSVQTDIQVHNSTAFNSGSLVAECQTAFVASAAFASCTPSPALPDGTYYVRSKASDSMQWGPWTGTYTFKVAASAPAAPVINCPSAANGSWGTDVPGSAVSCTISAASSAVFPPNAIKYTVDGATAKTVSITQSSDPNVAKTTITVPNVKGGHRIAAWAIVPSAIQSTEADYGFGFGAVGMDTPAVDPVTVTTSAVKVQASGPAPAGGTTATAELKWRLPSGGDANTGWNTAATLPVTTDPATGGVIAAGTWDTTLAAHDTAANIDTDPRVATTLELQICITYSSGTQCTWTTQNTRVLRVPHAFGAGFPTTDAGPGQVALRTGEFTTSATDVTVPGYTGTLSLSRTHSTYAGPANPAASVFGPGWTASLDGTDNGGLGGSQLIDNTLVDGTLVLLDSEGTPMVFAPGGNPVRRTGADLATGSWTGVDPDTIQAGVKATVTSTGSSTVVAFTEPDGTATTFKPFTAPASGVAGVFGPDSVAQPGDGTTTYTRDAQGRVTRILAPLPTGLTSTNCPGTGSLSAGCRAIDITYAATTTATTSSPGDFAGQVKTVTLQIFNPAKTGGAGMDSIAVATYKYDTTGRMTSVTDPRTNLTTSYAYDSLNRLTSLTPAGQAAFTINYAGTPARFQNVTRPNPASAGGGTATLTSVVYGVPTSGNGLPDFSVGAVAGWRQTSAPIYAAAVFGQDHPVSSIDPANISSADWPYADIQATDARGYTVNAASYGAGDWQRTATDYDAATHQVIRTLSSTDIDQVISAGADPATVGRLTVYNTSGNGPVNTPDGSVPVDTYETTREMTLADGSVVQARPHTHITYDEGSPNSGTNSDTGLGWALPTTATATVSSPLIAGGDLAAEPANAFKMGYGPDTASWKLGQEVTQTQVVDGGSGDITRAVGYDAEGRVVVEQQPTSNGSDAGTRKTVYYTVAANGTFPECGSKPEWAGAICKTYFAAQATGHDLITTTYTGYSAYLAPVTITETANGATRTTTTTFDAAGRPWKSSTTATGLTGSTAVNGTENVYDTVTGQPTQQWALNSTGARTGDPIGTGYDTWGRVLSYSPSSSETTTTTFNTAGQVTSIADPAGTKTFGYGNDAAGKVEHRGMPTSVAYNGGPSGNTLTFTGAYDRSGNLFLQTLPGALTQRTAFDTAGAETGLTYSGQVTTTNSDGSTTVNPDGAWLGWSINRDAHGRVIRENTPAAGAYVSGGVDPNVTISAAPYDRSYTYDKASRLTKVQDRTAVAGAGVEPVTGEPTGAGCVTRAYSFDKNGNRLSLAASPSAGDGTCQTASGTTTRNWTWDAGDRTTNSGNVFDAFGRQTTLPAVDAPKSGNGNVTLGYYDTDAIKSITQNGATTSWTLDQAQRRAAETTGTKTTARHYTDGSDNPGYVDVTENNVVTTTRYGASLGGDLGLNISANGTDFTAQVTLADPHGDIVATSDVTGTAAPAVGIAGWVDHDEYGNPLPAGSAASLTKGVGYGWVGAKQRATLDTGLTLMGARVYNSSSGQFTSADPVFGGNSTTYAYPTDPVNSSDPTGKFEWCGKTCRGWIWWGANSIVSTVASSACTAITGLYFMCDVIVGATMGALDYYVKTTWVNRQEASWHDARMAGINGALQAMGGARFGHYFAKKIRAFFRGSGRHAAEVMTGRLRSFGLDWLAGSLWWVWNLVAGIMYDLVQGL